MQNLRRSFIGLTHNTIDFKPLKKHTLIWGDETWVPGSLNDTFNIDGIDVSIEVEDSTNSLVDSPPLPLIGPFQQGGLPSIEPTFILASKLENLGSSGDIKVMINFSKPVLNPRFDVFDLDGVVDVIPRKEVIELHGSDENNIPTEVQLSGGSSVHVQGNIAMGIEPLDTTGVNSGDGTLNVKFNGFVKKILLKFYMADGSVINMGSTPGFSIHDISFDTVENEDGFYHDTESSSIIPSNNKYTSSDEDDFLSFEQLNKWNVILKSVELPRDVNLILPSVSDFKYARTSTFTSIEFTVITLNTVKNYVLQAGTGGSILGNPIIPPNTSVMLKVLYRTHDYQVIVVK